MSRVIIPAFCIKYKRADVDLMLPISFLPHPRLQPAWNWDAASFVSPEKQHARRSSQCLSSLTIPRHTATRNVMLKTPVLPSAVDHHRHFGGQMLDEHHPRTLLSAAAAIVRVCAVTSSPSGSRHGYILIVGLTVAEPSAAVRSRAANRGTDWPLRMKPGRFWWGPGTYRDTGAAEPERPEGRRYPPPPFSMNGPGAWSRIELLRGGGDTASRSGTADHGAQRSWLWPPGWTSTLSLPAWTSTPSPPAR